MLWAILAVIAVVAIAAYVYKKRSSPAETETVELASGEQVSVPASTVESAPASTATSTTAPVVAPVVAPPPPSVKGQKIRFNPVNTSVRIGDLKVYDDNGNQLVRPDLTFTKDNARSPTEGAANMFDSDDNTMYVSASTTAATPFTVDLGQVSNITKISIKNAAGWPGDAGVFNQYRQLGGMTIDVLGSDDSVVWTSDPISVTAYMYVYEPGKGKGMTLFDREFKEPVDFVVPTGAPVTARFVRVTHPDNAGFIEFIVMSNGKNIATAATASTTSVQASALSKAFDSVQNTYYMADSAAGTVGPIIMDFGAEVPIDYVMMIPRGGSSSTYDRVNGTVVELLDTNSKPKWASTPFKNVNAGAYKYWTRVGATTDAVPMSLQPTPRV